MAQKEVAKIRHKCRIRELKDVKDTSKAFFKKLKAKHRKETISKLIDEDGSEITHSQHLMQKCVDYYTKLLNVSKDESSERQQAMDVIRDFN